MIILRTGVPGASKTLNSLKELVENHDAQRPYFYHNVKLLMLDHEVCQSFSGWFYGWYWPRLKDKAQRKKIMKIMKPIHDEDEFLQLENVPWLQAEYESHDHFHTWYYWVERVYPKKKIQRLQDFLQASDNDSEMDYFEASKQFNLDFRHFDDVKDWYHLPKRAVIFIDECQQYFPPRPVGGKKPEYIGKFETHRHSGHDVHLVTQDGMLIDVNIRRLTGRHVHFHNAFGGERVTRFQSPKYFNPDDFHDKKQATKKVIKRDKKFYGCYWSAEIHTHSFQLPKIVLLLPICLGVIGYSLYSLSDRFLGSDDIEPKNSTQIEQASTVAAVEGESLASTVLGQLAKDVYISGSVISLKDGQMYFDYSFINTETQAVFYPERVGITVNPVSHCLVNLVLDTAVFPITCNPFYVRDVMEDKEEENKTAGTGEPITGVEIF